MSGLTCRYFGELCVLRLVVNAGPHEGLVLESVENPITIGRSSSCMLRLADDKLVSRMHGEIRLAGGQYLYLDSGSKYGSTIESGDNERRLENSEASVPLNHLDQILIGRSCLLVQLQPVDTSEDLLSRLKRGDRQAANELISRYFERVAGAARRRLKQRRLRGTDSEDIAASVFESLWKKVDRKQFADDELATSDEFWRLLCTMIRFKTEDHVRREYAEKRGGGEVRGESVFMKPGDQDSPGIAGQPNQELSAGELASLRDQHQKMMGLLGDEVLQEVVTLRMEGYKVAEIATRFDKSERWAKRKLAMIREIWQEQLEADSA